MQGSGCGNAAVAGSGFSEQASCPALLPAHAMHAVPSTQSVGYVAQRQQIEQLLFLLSGQRYGMVAAFLKAAVKKQGLEV